MKRNLVSVFSLSCMVAFVGANAQVKQDSTKEKTIEEVVLVNVGYGKQKKSVVTGAISQVTAKDLEKVPNGGVGTMLQGRSSGVTVAANSGAPGSGATIRVRGITTFGGANDPLWVVDGVPLENADIANINQADIASMEILKDAASAAIYGTRAAKGVILITTKKGRKGRMNISYNGFISTSSAAKTLKLLNSTEYAALMNERSLAGGGGVLYTNIGSLGVGTDWQKQVFSNNAMGTNHELSISGSSENSDFYLSFNTQNTAGIVAQPISNYDKKSFRINSNHTFLDRITVGESVFYTHQRNVGIGTSNSEFGGVLSDAIMLDPLTPIIETDPVVLNSNPNYLQPNIVRDANGNAYGISNVVGQEIVNPLAYIETQKGNFGYSDTFIGSAYVGVKLIKGLNFKTTVNGKKAWWGGQSFTPLYYLNANSSNTANNVLSRTASTGFDWSVENTLTYETKLGNHDFNLLIGQGTYENGMGNTVGATHTGLPSNSWVDASFNVSIPEANKRGYSYNFIPVHRTSLFARLNYNYKEKYLFTGIIRRDGSSLFGPDNKYGIFPSGSVGWVVSKENFWKDNSIVQMLKLRFGYGVNGNDGALAANQYESLLAYNYNYFINDLIQIGAAPATIANPNLKWEQTTQTNIGVDMRLVKNINVTAEYFDKKTAGILRQFAVPGYVGVANNPYGNIADMSNKGFEFEVNYRKSLGNVNFSASGNFSTLKNEVTNLGDAEYYDENGFQSLQGSLTRLIVGQPYGSFYGFKTAGIFQNWADVKAYTGAGGALIQPNAQPGDFRWQDTNGDGVITDADKVFLGQGLPTFNYGLTLNFDYKGFDLSALFQGAGGNKIFQGLRRLDVSTANYQTRALGRWTGEGTSNDYPRLTSNDTNGNFTRMSDFYLENGDYLRLKLVSFGYSLPKSLTENIHAQKIRIYVSGSNLLTLTKYTGYDPEIGGTTLGIDKGFYPQARTFIFGINAQF
ncbi:TonB-linked outer membrane protein, SusC/RagA family [Halpernia humi]|uniref:TonB-linked outer membrane protein, SusC/RagA family n=1 Tax=Halpernia humi TaxID=493375 RepID=A0A1H5WNL3_9FLAO|nr:TonB-dependent receptor [Halpernia humi]SEG00816.1 TonB-linked outer membrane protein, SusC/RagA family [Halpernia humi]